MAMALTMVGLSTATTTKLVAQWVRKTGIPNNQVYGTPCLVCKYLKLHVDFWDVKVLEQFVCVPRSIIFHAPYTGVCMKQHKLTQATQRASECGLLSYYIPQIEPRDADYLPVHGAVNMTPPASILLSGER